jgi:hypothetical protein
MILLEILIWLLAGLVGLIFVILLAVLYIPIRYKLQAVSRDERRALIMVTWFGGLLRFSFQYQQGQGFKSQFSLFGKMIKPGPHKKTKKQARKKKARKRRKQIFQPQAAQTIIASLAKVLKHLLPTRVEGYGRLGFADPYWTGITCAWLETLRGFKIHHLNLEYIFDREVYEGEILVEGAIYLAYIVYIATRLLLNRSAREMMFG